MTADELRKSIERTNDQICELKQQIKEVTNIRKKLKLRRRLIELQYLQLWHIDLLERGIE
ncbi:MAG TPA: hypothetical protein DCK79_00895 [Candidatus Atribacteria bacterium]|nr:MAG: hypothetical protein XD75_0348 [Parcubacteria bacterium 33_209]HAJ31923.1 hypothetical protein [Candidatus Atribacteria bacterium]